jgi:hypothetical protein
MLVYFAAALLFASSAGRAAQPQPAQKGEPSPEAVKAQKAVEEFLVKHKADNARVTVVGDTAELPKLFRDYQFVAVHFAEWPVARVPPEPLTSRNLFVVGKDGKVLHLTDAKGLETFFKDKLAPSAAGLPLAGAVEGWLRLSQEFVQDGYYKFELDKGKGIGGVSSDGKRMQSGSLSVVPEMGNKGRLSAELSFDAKGKLLKVVEENKVVRGIRPRCQATRLLDADPVVRAICEQDLLVMGKAAQAYLMEKRAGAGPELQREIDRVWQKILDEGR